MEKVTVPNEILLPEIARMVAEGMSVTLRGKGNSMLPFIKGGRDSVVLQKPRDLKKGDIVLAKSETDASVAACHLPKSCLIIENKDKAL